MNIPLILLTLTFGVGCLQASEMEKSVQQLNHENFELRTQAHQTLLSQIQKSSSSETLESNMQKLFDQHMIHQSPEVHTRLYSIMKALAPQLQKSKGRAFIGLQMTSSSIDQDRQYTPTVLINGVKPGSPADKAGIKVGDQITSIAGIEISNRRNDAVTHLLNVMKLYTPGETIQIIYFRKKVQHSCSITLEKFSQVAIDKWQKKPASKKEGLKEELKGKLKNLVKPLGKNARPQIFEIAPNGNMKLELGGRIDPQQMQQLQVAVKKQGGQINFVGGGFPQQNQEENLPDSFFQRWYKRQVLRFSKSPK